jgi:PAS domain-containing protein
LVTRAGESRAARAEGRVAARFNAPRAARVEADPNGRPLEVNHRAVALVREEWRVVDRWWTEDPIDRRYFEVVLESGENTVVFHDGASGGWYTQRGA